MSTINHIGFLMDGNRRWAKEHHLPIAEGHRRGYQKLKEVANWCINKGIKTVSVYAFSTENWNRKKDEVEFLMKLFRMAVVQDTAEFNKMGLHINILGSRDNFDKDMLEHIRIIEEETKHNTKKILNVCFNYGGRLEIVEAVKEIIKKGFKTKDITEELIEKHMWFAGQSDPDLIIRTSGEKRLSGFLTWESVYSELCFLNCHWPALSEKILDTAIEDFQNRKRRFGGN